MQDVIDIGQLINDIKDVASGILKKDISVIRGFQERQVIALATQANLIAAGVLSGDIDEGLRKYFLEGLEDMALNFVKTLRGLIDVTIEKVWNAVVDTILKAIGKVIDIVL